MEQRFVQEYLLVLYSAIFKMLQSSNCTDVHVCRRWISLGNQLNGTRLVDPDLRRRFQGKYPGVEIQPSDTELKECDNT